MQTQIEVNAKSFNNVGELAAAIKAMAVSDPHSYRKIARIGVFPGSAAIVLETTQEQIRLADKAMSAVLQGPTEPGAIYLGSIQRLAEGGVIYTADDARFGQYSARDELNAAVMDPYQKVTQKIAFASGNKAGQHAWLTQGDKTTYCNNEGLFDLVVVPQNLGGGLVARTNRNGRQQTLLSLKATSLQAGKVNLENWTDLTRFNSPIVGINLRFRGTFLVVTLKDGQESVDCSQLGRGTVQRAETNQHGMGFTSVAAIEDTDLGLFATQAGHPVGKTQTVVARTTRAGLPAAQIQTA